MSARILIVDDDPAVREFARRALLMAGYDVHVATGGSDGLTQLAAVPDIGLVLLDLDMPDVDGRSFRAAQRHAPELAAIPTVMLSAAEMTPELRHELLAMAYVRKPVTVVRLQQVAAAHCRS